MKYWTRCGNGNAFMMTAEDACKYLRGAYKDAFVDYIMSHGIHFRLSTPYRDIWTSDEGKVPMAGFYGTIEEVPDDLELR